MANEWLTIQNKNNDGFKLVAATNTSSSERNAIVVCSPSDSQNQNITFGVTQAGVTTKKQTVNVTLVEKIPGGSKSYFFVKVPTRDISVMLNNNASYNCLFDNLDSITLKKGTTIGGVDESIVTHPTRTFDINVPPTTFKLQQVSLLIAKDSGGQLNPNYTISVSGNLTYDNTSGTLTGGSHNNTNDYLNGVDLYGGSPIDFHDGKDINITITITYIGVNETRDQEGVGDCEIHVNFNNSITDANVYAECTLSNFSFITRTEYSSYTDLSTSSILDDNFYYNFTGGTSHTSADTKYSISGFKTREEITEIGFSLMPTATVSDGLGGGVSNQNGGTGIQFVINNQTIPAQIDTHISTCRLTWTGETYTCGPTSTITTDASGGSVELSLNVSIESETNKIRFASGNMPKIYVNIVIGVHKPRLLSPVTFVDNDVDVPGVTTMEATGSWDAVTAESWRDKLHNENLSESELEELLEEISGYTSNAEEIEMNENP